ncbi:MAG TPA: DMT family transporter [Ideonella sp.]|nr:DMT family transporter [Ideonella sp.]
MPDPSRSFSRPFAIAALLVATAAWGSLFLVGKAVLAHVDPVWFTLIRYSLATAAFAALVAWRGTAPWQKLRAHAPRLALFGFVGYGVFSVMLLVGLMHSVPSHAAVLMATMPITTQLVRWVLDGQKPARSALLGAALALSGVVVVSGELWADAGAGPSTLWGDLTVLAGTLGWVAYTRASASFPQLDVLEYTALTAIASWPLLLASALAATLLGWSTGPSAADLSLSWSALLYIGAVPSVIAILGFNLGVRTLGPVSATAFLNFVPVSAMLMSAALGKPPVAHELVGSAMVVGALLLHTLAQRRAGAAPAAAALTTPSARSPAPRPPSASPRPASGRYVPGACSRSAG